jgi:beta-galactosidase
MRDAKGRFVPTACCELEFTAPERYRILGWGNGDPGFQYAERPLADGKVKVFNGRAQVIMKKY